MENILGVDLGNFATKTSEGVKFSSRVSLGYKKINANDIKVEYNKKRYTVGTGSLNIGESRIGSTLYDLCLLTAIAKSYPKQKNITVNLVMGLPPLQYESDLKDKLEKKLNDLGAQKINIDGRDIIIVINKAIVFSESAIVFSDPAKYKDKKTLVVDLGGGSLDICQFDSLELKKRTTTKLGMLTLYESMRQVFNPKEHANYTQEDMEDLLGKETATVKGTEKDISYLDDIVKEHVTEAESIMNQNFDTESTDIILIGGGAEKLADYFKEEYKNIEAAKDSQFVNAKTFAAVGGALWSEK